MKNEQKVEKICCTQGCSGGIERCIKIYGQPCPTYTNCLEMAEWKDQQFAEEKKQWVEKAFNLIENNIDTYLSINRDMMEAHIDRVEFIKFFKQAMGE